jgi:rubrerythrin
MSLDSSNSNEYRRTKSTNVIHRLIDATTPLTLGRSTVVVHECRRCGATLDSPDDSCPYADHEDVVTYVIR